MGRGKKRIGEGEGEATEGGGHPSGEPSGSGADELSKVDEDLLVGPEESLRAQVRNPLKEERSLRGG